MAIPQLEFQYYPANIIGSILLFLGFTLVYKLFLKKRVYNIQKKKYQNQSMEKKINHLIVEDNILKNQMEQLTIEENNLINQNNYIAYDEPTIVLTKYKKEKQKQFKKEIKDFLSKTKDNPEILIKDPRENQ